MKRINIVYTLCLCMVLSHVRGQSDCLPVNSTVTFNNPTGIDYYNCIDVNGNVIGGTVGTQNYDVLSATKITVAGESVIRPGTSLATRLLIKEEPILVRRIFPSTPNVPKYEKIEFGIGLPSLAEEQIQNFVSNIPNTVKLNPFDPLDVDIKAIFQWEPQPGLWYTKGQQYGFYYREYQLDTTGPSVAWHRDEITLEEHFRVRYSPPQVGKWRVQFVIFLKNINTYTTGYYYFDVIESDNPGYMKVAQGGKYFEVGNDIFFPIGQNEAYPECVSEYCSDMPIYTTPEGVWSLESYGSQKSPVKSYRMYHKVLEKMKAGGANYFRMLVNQWGLEIEFEELGNYYGRMEQTWEMDRIMDKADELDLRMTWNMALHTYFEDGSIYWFVNWDFPSGDCNSNGWCYNTIPGVNTPQDVMTNATAKRYYKNRLRYLISRYGYSTNIGLVELVSEINNIGQGDSYDIINDTCREVGSHQGKYNLGNEQAIDEVQNWQIDMLSYIKNDLGHTEHLTGVSYAGGPDSTDLIYHSSVVDYIGFNYYQNNITRFEAMPDIFYDKYRMTQGLYKPLFNGEIGVASEFSACGAEAEWHKNIWITPFTGFAGSGLSWDHMFHLGFPYFGTYGHLKDFLQGCDFRDGPGIDWLPVKDVREDKKAETYAMRADYANSHMAIGVVLNRSYNYHTMATDTPCINRTYQQLLALGFVPFNMSPLNVAWVGAPNRLKLPGMGVWMAYTIEWYNCLTGAFISQSNKTSDIAGDLYLEHPELTGNAVQPMVAYKIYSASRGRSAEIPMEENEAVLLRADERRGDESLANLVSLYPNPTEGQVIMEISPNMEEGQWKLASYPGKILLTGFFQSGRNIINLENLPTGIYMLTLRNGTGVYTFKLIRL